METMETKRTMETTETKTTETRTTDTRTTETKTTETKTTEIRSTEPAQPTESIKPRNSTRGKQLDEKGGEEGLEGGKTRELPRTDKTIRNDSYTRLNKTPHMDVYTNTYTNKQFRFRMQRNSVESNAGARMNAETTRKLIRQKDDKKTKDKPTKNRRRRTDDEPTTTNQRRTNDESTTNQRRTNDEPPTMN